MGIDDLIARIRATSDPIEVLYAARSACWSDDWAGASEAAMDANDTLAQSVAYDDAGETVWLAVQDVFQRAVAAIAEAAAEDFDLVEAGGWQAACHPAHPRVDIASLTTEDAVRDVVEKAVLNVAQTVIAHAAGAVLVKDRISNDQYAALTNFLSGSEQD